MAAPERGQGPALVPARPRDAGLRALRVGGATCWICGADADARRAAEAREFVFGLWGLASVCC